MSGVIKLKTEQMCKLCSSPHRDLIDELLLKRSRRESDANGVLVNGDYVITQLRNWGVTNPTLDNLKLHWRKHCEAAAPKGAKGVDASTPEAAAALDELVSILDSHEYPDTLDGKLRRIFDLGFAEMVVRIRKGERSGISLDQLRWVSSELTRRQHNESQADLLAALGGGIATAEITAVKATVSVKPPQTPVLEPAPLVVEDGEFEDIDLP